MLSFSLPDENVCARHESDELCVYRSNAVGDKNQAARLLAQHAAAASMSPDGKHAAVFNPEKKSMPASAKVHALPEFGSGKTEMQPLAMRTFYRAKTASLLWSPSSVSCVVWAASDVDATNKSYYGESGMHVVRPDGNGQRVEVEKEGPVHDVSWSPAGDTFISVQGYLPTPAVCVHDLFGNKKQKVLNDSFNGVAWNRFGNFVALYGFGNLPGDITFLDKKPDGKLKTFASTRMRSHTALEWLADGRHLAISALTPRIREGNGFMIMKYSGEHVFDKRYNELTAVCSVGMSEKDASQFNRPPSPSAKQNRAKGSAEKSEANTYRPAHLKNVQPLPTQQGSFSSDAYKPPKQREEAEGPPGSEGMSLGGGQTKNAKKRERQKKKKQEAGEANGYGGAS
jgi:translation initiation factor 2A